MSAETTPSLITLDHLVPIHVDAVASKRLHNEFQVLNAWCDGLYFLYSQMRHMESYSWDNIRDELSGSEKSSEPPKFILNNLACCFQWYAVTLCNFVELVGCIGRELDPTRKPPRDYVKDVIPAVLAYRNKVGAHVARARKNNPADQLASMIPSSALNNGRYFSSSYTVTIRRSGQQSVSTGQPWSLTEIHESLAERYWPKFVPQ